AYLVHGALVRRLAESDPRFHIAFSLEPLVLVFIVAATLASALLFGVLPAWLVTNTDVGEHLKESRGAVRSLGQMRSGRLLVSVQLALSFPLLVGAGLLARTVYNLQRADLGFNTREVLLVRVDLREAGYENARRAPELRELLGQLQLIPGVRATSFSQLGVLSGGESSWSIEVEGYTPTGEQDRGSALDVIGPRYFSTLGIPIRMGREILETDRADAPKVC